MQVRSIYRGARISAFKCREVTHAIQGLPAGAAVDLLTFTPKKAAQLVLKTLKSAIANAENNNNLRADSLIVQEAVVGEGPTMKRFQPVARGSAHPILKRSSHIKITLTDDLESLPRRTRARAESRLPKDKSKKFRPKGGATKKSKATPAVAEPAEVTPSSEANS
ncbi:MAG: 50S ribosomal protein L22 [Chthoniobacteraceae bacterium]